jgi:hypothetical protein
LNILMAYAMETDANCARDQIFYLMTGNIFSAN